MSKKAVDVVLLPGGEIVYKIIRLNKRLATEFGDRIILDKENCLPHISLAMGCVGEKAVPAIAEVLKDIAKKNPAGRLQIAGVSVSENARGEKVSSLEIVRTQKLQRLHEAVMDEVGRYFSYDVTEDMIYPSGDVAESTLEWIKNYRKKSSFERFWPHITIGYGILEDVKFTAKITALKLALCHLGNHCTCRKVLAAVEI